MINVMLKPTPFKTGYWTCKIPTYWAMDIPKFYPIKTNIVIKIDKFGKAPNPEAQNPPKQSQ